ncbi:uncharacterized protein [Macrobrachium rosenbergii]|uniref:uncharacterized protein isoform X2 n=1 Tax=Macrobrachium rosenbergii TaxID=79674 RepID=UPI0034D77ADF
MGKYEFLGCRDRKLLVPAYRDEMQQSYLDYITVRRMLALANSRIHGPLTDMPGMNSGVNDVGLGEVPQMPSADNPAKFGCSAAARNEGESSRSDGPASGSAEGFWGLRGHFNGFPPCPNFPLGAGSGFGKSGFPGPVDFFRSRLRQSRNEPYSVPVSRERYLRQPHDQMTPGYAANIFPSAMVNAAIRNAVNLSISSSGNCGTRSLTSNMSLYTDPTAAVGVNVTVASPSERNVNANETLNSVNDETSNPVSRNDLLPSVSATVDLTREAITSTNTKDTDDATTEASDIISVKPSGKYPKENSPSTEHDTWNSSNSVANGHAVNGIEAVQNTGATSNLASGAAALPDIVRFIGSSCEFNMTNATAPTNLRGGMALGASGGEFNFANATATTNPTGGMASRASGVPRLQSGSVSGNRQHMLQQLNSRLCRCVLCEFVTRDMNVLMEHIDSHFPVRTYICIHCTCLFSGPEELQEHSCPFRH